MEEQTLISVIIPVYNGERYIHECVDSVLNQTYQNIECILVDGQSPDRCSEICDQYALRDNRVKVIHKTNNGLSDDRNAGIKIARGEYLTFVDSDDYISKDMIKALYDVCYRYQVLLAQCNFIQNGPLEKIVDYEVRANILSKEQCFLNLCGPNSAVFCVSWGKLYHKSLFSNIRFPYGKTHEDVYTTHLFFEKAEKTGYVTKALYYYRQHDDSLMGKERKKPDLNELNSYIYRSKFFKKRGYSAAYERQVWSCINMIKNLYLCNYELWSKNQRKYMRKKYRELLYTFVKTQKDEVSVDHCFFACLPDLYYYILKLKETTKKIILLEQGLD